jgi:hypothetical protein
MQNSPMFLIKRRPTNYLSIDHGTIAQLINLQQGKRGSMGSRDQSITLWTWSLGCLGIYRGEFDTNGFIQYSRSLACTPTFFVKKTNGSHRLIMDYQGLNKMTI